MAVTSDILRRLAKLRLEPAAYAEVLSILADMQEAEDSSLRQLQDAEAERLRRQREKKQRQRGTVPGQSRDKGGSGDGGAGARRAEPLTRQGFPDVSPSMSR